MRCSLFHYLYTAIVFCYLLVAGVATFASTSEQNLIDKANQLEKSIPQLRQQIVNTIQEANTAQQQVTNQISKLQQQNTNLQNRVDELSQQLDTAKTQSNETLETASTASMDDNVYTSADVMPNKSKNPNTKFTNQYQPMTMSEQGNKMFDLKLIIGLAILILLILMWMFWCQPETKIVKKSTLKAPPNNHASAPVFEGGEYDFMNSDEAIPIKLDLARAYIDMGDFAAAKETLEAVMAQGHETQQNEARALLAKIPA